MDLIKAYEEFTGVNNAYVNFVEGLLNSDLGDCNNEKITEHLLAAQNSFETIKIRTDVMEVEAKEQENYRDLKYLVMDALFISADLTAFYKYKQPERFKMRATNYINKKRRAEMFKEDKNSKCRV
ncbi:MAG: hypothetical protein ACRC68_09640 [Clostridium sp.]